MDAIREQLAAQVTALRRERDALRDALTAIADGDGGATARYVNPTYAQTVLEYQEWARAALREVSP